MEAFFSIYLGTDFFPLKIDKFPPPPPIIFQPKRVDGFSCVLTQTKVLTLTVEQLNVRDIPRPCRLLFAVTQMCTFRSKA